MFFTQADNETHDHRRQKKRKKANSEKATIVNISAQLACSPENRFKAATKIIFIYSTRCRDSQS